MKWILLELLFIAVQLIGFIPFYFIWRKDCKEIGKEHLAVSLKNAFGRGAYLSRSGCFRSYIWRGTTNEKTL